MTRKCPGCEREWTRAWLNNDLLTTSKTLFSSSVRSRAICAKRYYYRIPLTPQKLISYLVSESLKGHYLHNEICQLNLVTISYINVYYVWKYHELTCHLTLRNGQFYNYLLIDPFVETRQELRLSNRPCFSKLQRKCPRLKNFQGGKHSSLQSAVGMAI